MIRMPLRCVIDWSSYTHKQRSTCHSWCCRSKDTTGWQHLALLMPITLVAREPIARTQGSSCSFTKFPSFSIQWQQQMQERILWLLCKVEDTWMNFQQCLAKLEHSFALYSWLKISLVIGMLSIMCRTTLIESRPQSMRLPCVLLDLSLRTTYLKLNITDKVKQQKIVKFSKEYTNMTCHPWSPCHS